MSKRLAAQVAKTTAATGTGRALLLAIATRADSRGVADVTLEVIASDAGCGVTTAKREIKKLVDRSILDRTERHTGNGLGWSYRVQPSGATPSTPTTSGVGTRRDSDRTKRVRSDTLTSVVNVRAKALTPRARARVSQSQASPKEPTVADFRRVWNEHCAPLPRMLVEPASADAKRLISLAWKAVDGDAQLLGASIDRAAKDGYYSEHRYTFPTFCRHLERWLDDQAGKPVAKVEVMPSTNGVRDQVLALLAAGDDVDPGGWRPEQRAAVKAAIAEFRGKRPR